VIRGQIKVDKQIGHEGSSSATVATDAALTSSVPPFLPPTDPEARGTAVRGTSCLTIRTASQLTLSSLPLKEYDGCGSDDEDSQLLLLLQLIFRITDRRVKMNACSADEWR
jgi:hypothetical protein